MAEQKQRAPFSSGVTNYSDIKKRMEELGIKPVTGGNGVSVVPAPEIRPEPGDYMGY